MINTNTDTLKLSEFLRNGLIWPLNLVRDLPKRAGRLAGAIGAVSKIRGADVLVYWLHSTLWYSFDIVGGPEIIQILIRTLSDTRALSSEEITTVKSVLGPKAIRFQDVRIASGGLLIPVFKRNGNRAFATWHTVNIPASKSSDRSLLVHELTHVYQYERVGSPYIGQGLWAQHKHKKDAYHYGGAEGLLAGRAAGKRLCDYNREQQCQIAQDFSTLLLEERDTEAFSPFIHDLRHGLL
ncbi:MAG TPA: DUF4157 domain-containing protein [candidate division Zixibacteria bacterium]|nr:DUF4157 domain-containing protein [candidate division Zixibacteria bacterium]